MQKKLLWITSIATIFGLVIYAGLRLSEDRGEDPSELLVATVKGSNFRGGIKPRQVDPAHSITSEWTSDPDHLDAWRRHAKDAVAPRLLNAGGDRKWSETVLTIDGDFFGWESRRACGLEHGPKITKACKYAVDMVVSPDEVGKWRVTYARGLPTAMTERQDLNGCVEFSACVAQGRVGLEVPMPDTVTDDAFALRHELSASPMPESLKDPQAVQEDIDIVVWMADATRDELAQDSGNGRMEHQLAKLERELAYKRKWLHELLEKSKP